MARTSKLDPRVATPDAPLAPGVQDALNEAADALGIRPDQIQVADGDWVQYAQEGVVCEVEIGRYRAELQVRPSDLGLAPVIRAEGESDDDYRKRVKAEEEKITKVLKLGNRYLLPERVRKAGNSLEEKARTDLRRSSYRTPFGYWIPRQSYAAYKARRDEIAAQYQGWLDDVLANYDAYRQETLAEYIGLGGLVFDRLAQAGYFNREPAYFSDGFDFKLAWIRARAAEWVRQIEGPEQIKARHKFKPRVFLLPMQAQVAADRAEADRVGRAAVERARIEAYDAMEADIRLSAARDAAYAVNGFAKDVQAQLQAVILEATRACLDEMKKGGGKLPKNSVKAVKGLIERVGSLKFWSEPGLDARLEDLNRLIETDAKARDNVALAAVLRELRDTSRLTILELERADARQARAVDLGDDLIEGAAPERAARRDLDAGSDLLDEPVQITERRARRNDSETAAL